MIGWCSSLLGAFGVLALIAATAPLRAETRTGYAVYDLWDGRPLAAERSGEAFIPASVVKVPMALAVLDTLGPEHRFATRLLASAAPDAAGRLRGDLVLSGDGDPSLDLDGLRALADRAAAAGLRVVEGRFLFDAGALPTQPSLDGDQPPFVAYNPPLSGLALDYNRVFVTWTRGVPQARRFPFAAQPAVLPPARPEEGRDWLPIADPPALAAQTLAHLLAERGITVPPPQPGRAPESAAPPLELASHHSAPLGHLLREGMRFSNNLMAEMLALHATRAPSVAAAGEAIAAYVRASLPRGRWDGLVLPNGSGLSMRGRMTPEQCAVLAARLATRSFGPGDEPGRSYLPAVEVTEDGRVRRAGAAPPAKGKKGEPPPFRLSLHAKTGTVYYARALAGVMPTAGGRELAFCVMTEDRARRTAYDALPFAERESAARLGPARAWLKVARETESALLLDWHRRF